MRRCPKCSSVGITDTWNEKTQQLSHRCLCGYSWGDATGEKPPPAAAPAAQPPAPAKSRTDLVRKQGLLERRRGEVLRTIWWTRINSAIALFWLLGAVALASNGGVLKGIFNGLAALGFMVFEAYKAGKADEERSAIDAQLEYLLDDSEP